MSDVRHNNRVHLSVRVVTVRACARPAPTRPAGDADRWTASDHNFPDSGFRRIFSGTE